MKYGILVFPGSNCDRDMYDALKNDLGQQVEYLWHKDKTLEGYDPATDCVILPGGFSYGDYLRCGAIARFSPLMQEVKEFAEEGGKVFGVCNGFQVLCEAGLLPGVLLRNENQQYICKNVHIKGEESGKTYKIPIAHGEGRYYASDEVLDQLEANNQVVYRYVNEGGEDGDGCNPNGAVRNIAGIRNKAGNVIGMMPHPERASSAELGNEDGKTIFRELGLVK